MDTRTGEIYTRQQVVNMDEIDRRYMRPMAYDPTPTQRSKGRVGRNDPCPCGSAKKFKRCCIWRAR